MAVFDKQEQTTKTVLVVEDDQAFVNIIKAQLEKNGLTTLTCQTVDEALKVLETSKIDLIWLDHYLIGDRTGYDFVSTIKKDNRYNKIPIFVVTNYDDYGNATQFLEKLSGEQPKTYLEYGIDKYFVKSNTKLEDIIAAVKKRLKI